MPEIMRIMRNKEEEMVMMVIMKSDYDEILIVNGF